MNLKLFVQGKERCMYAVILSTSHLCPQPRRKDFLIFHSDSAVERAFADAYIREQARVQFGR